MTLVSMMMTVLTVMTVLTLVTVLTRMPTGLLLGFRHPLVYRPWEVRRQSWGGSICIWWPIV